jgi:hypothetical protein
MTEKPQCRNAGSLAGKSVRSWMQSTSGKIRNALVESDDKAELWTKCRTKGYTDAREIPQELISNPVRRCDPMVVMFAAKAQSGSLQPKRDVPSVINRERSYLQVSQFCSDLAILVVRSVWCVDSGK